MKKFAAALLAVLFLGVASGPVWADNAKPMTTPTAKTMKHKKSTHKRVKGKKGKKMMKKKMKPASTPTK